jgi:hypothetical protein
MPEPLTAATVIASGGDISWDYVALGASMTIGFVDKYADHIEADLGVEVTVHNWCRGDQGSHLLLPLLRNDEELRNDIREAEVVTFEVAPQRMGGAAASYRYGKCGGPDNEDCLREALRLHKADTDAIIAEILSLRSTSDTIIRATTSQFPYVNSYKEGGHFEGVHPYWLALNEYVVQAASKHDEDPGDKGYLGSDEFHPSQVGLGLIADLHRELGYGPLAP